MNYLSQLKPQEKLDLYKIALGFVRNKMKWDMKSAARESRKALFGMKDQFQGKKAIILCNGPSLNKVDFDQLIGADVYTIGLNKINLMFDETNFRPNLIVAVNKLVINQNLDYFNNSNIDIILDSSASPLVKKRKNVNFIHSLPFQMRFAGDVTGSVCQGYTVTYVALQIAYHLGFSKVALVGCDHYFATKGSPNMTVESGETDPNHFSSKYFSDGAKWQLPDLLGSEIHYKMAKEYYEANDREILNCSVGGYLEIFSRMELNSFINAR